MNAPFLPSRARGLIRRLEARQARIGMIGLGYAGFPLALRYAETGFRVTGFDIDPDKVAAVRAGRSPIHGIADSRVAAVGIEAQAEMAAAAACDALVICVPTPIGPHKEPDLSSVRDTLRALRPFLRPGQALSLESTTYPGTTEEHVLPVLDEAGLRVGRDAFCIYSPEREDPGNPEGTVGRVPKLVAGATPTCRAVGEALYAPVAGSVVPVSSLAVAELAKCYENVFRAVNIGLVNELKRLSHAMAIDVHEVIDAAATKPFGFMPFRPGPGLGGHCIPVDPYYLAWKARELGVPSDFIELAGRVNDAQPHYVVNRLRDALDMRGRTLRGARVLLLGLAYKPDVPDTRESPAVEIFRILEGHGAHLAYHDPLVPRFPATRRLSGTAPTLESQDLTPALLAEQDAVVIVTPHRGMPLDLVRRHARLVVDTRGALRQPPAAPPPIPWPVTGMREDQAGFLGPGSGKPGARLPGDTKGDLAPGGGGAYILPA
ncbi:nucleotide sugar dehydrogenase [Roseomonas gilardii subsp. gilardii]|uniref:nucleotide sugar dehydrogenase n=1 Tax=Roseomonas gilardii TaxID=257708 RepID=UPI001FF861FC|nr:nucleotide sugar dehydrogenase [Roseomonas gilardii]UPG72746.1 nucleotide sugar dehydrogenase [Roseomonas gilardii subsp. gilardii]